jgi:hypothetical protein
LVKILKGSPVGFKKAACAGFGKPGDSDGKSIPPRPVQNEIVQ